jgi:AMMECR1 domain-containing protein
MIAEELTIGGQRVRVEVRRARDDKHLRGCWGYYDPVNRRIVLARSLFKGGREELLAQTLIHEVLHAACDISGARGFQSRKREELLIGVLAPALARAFNFRKNET